MPLPVIKTDTHVSQSWLVLLVTMLCLYGLYNVTQLGRWGHGNEYLVLSGEYIDSAPNQLSFDDVTHLPDARWHVLKANNMNFGLGSSEIWMRIAVPYLNPKESWIVEVDYALLDQLSLWFTQQDDVLAEYHEGDKLPFRARIIKHEKFLFPVPQTNGEQTLYVKLNSEGARKFPIQLWKEQDYLVFNGEHNLITGLFFGFMAAMGVSNFFFFISSRSPMFLHYCGYVVFMALTMASLHGLGYKYLWPNNIWLQNHSIVLFANTTMFFAVQFSRTLLEVKNHHPRLAVFLKYVSIFFLLSALVSIWLPYSYALKLLLLTLIPAVSLMFAMGSWYWYKGVPLGGYYTFAWTTLLTGALAASLDNLNLLGYAIPTQYLLMLGASIETFFLALAVALSYSNQRQSLFDIQQEALDQAQHARTAQQEVIRLQEEAKDELEYKVQERTLELEFALRELSEINRELEKKNTTDGLTGVRNRGYFDKKYLAEVRRARREQTHLSIVMLDLDHFKQINDRWGHISGDACIKFVASSIAALLKRPADEICRYGGEEFALILPSTDADGAQQIIELIRQHIEVNPVPVPAGNIPLTISAGICTGVLLPDDQDERLLELADEALYQAKHQGRNRVISLLLHPEPTTGSEHAI